jgi:hypothetical protein
MFRALANYLLATALSSWMRKVPHDIKFLVLIMGMDVFPAFTL